MPVRLRKKKPCSTLVYAVFLIAITLVFLACSIAACSFAAASTCDVPEESCSFDDEAALSDVARQEGSEASDAESSVFASDFSKSKPAVLDFASGKHAFNLFNGLGEARSIGVEELPGVASAVDAFELRGYDVGFVVYDLSSGSGIGYNADLSVFSASTVKAPFVCYVMESLVDGGLVDSSMELYQDTTIPGTGIMADDGVDSYDLNAVVYNTVVYSDNTGYALLQEYLGGSGFESWVRATGVDAAGWAGTWYPYYSPRDLAKMWLSIGGYLESGSASSQFAEDLFSRSGESFIRQALDERHEVYSKPGFEIDVASDGVSMSCLSDAGFVRSDGRCYLLSVMSNADYDDETYTENAPLLIDLVCALDNVQSLLSS